MDTRSLLTNFYTLAHLPEIKYCIVKPLHHDDQVLLNVESDLRTHNPKLLATIYAKELHIFSIDGQDPPTTSKDFKVVRAPVLTLYPATLFKTNSNTPTPLTTILCVTFLKALKKLLILNLTTRKEIIPFGNAALLSNLDTLEIESKFIEDTDVGISIVRTPKQFESLNSLSSSLEGINSQYAIYLAPSGIRAYLVESTIQKSTTSKPANYTTITESLSILHNINIDPETCTWVKVIPNLSHLNGLTTQISDYLKPVANIKYLVWPVELCFVQKAEKLSSKSKSTSALSQSDPLSLIDDFVNLKASSQTKTPSTVPTSNNTPLNLESHLDHPTVKNDTPQSTQPSTVTAAIEPTESPVTNVIPQVEEEPTDSNWNYDDLFGDGEDDGEVEINDVDFDFFDDNSNNNNNNSNNGSTSNNDAGNQESGIKAGSDDEISLDVDELLDEDELDDDLASELERLTEMNDNEDENAENVDHNGDEFEEPEHPGPVEKNPYDIPLHEMTLTATPSPYQDPGAPLPVISPKNQRSKSIFSPLNFNPIIKANVDDKYADGGKFFVGRTNGDSGIPTMSITDSFGQDEGDDDDDDDDDDEEQDDEEDYDDDDGDESIYDEANIDGILENEQSRSSVESSENNGIGSASKVETSANETNKDSENLPDTIEPDQKKMKLSVGDSLRSSTSSPSEANNNGNGVPNCMPFLLRSIPLFTIPTNLFSDNPSLQLDKVESVAGEFLNQVVWNDTYSFEDLSETPQKIFNETETIERSIAQIFPDIHKTTLLEYAGFNKQVNINNVKEEDGLMSLDIESPLSSFQTGNIARDNSIRNSLGKTMNSSFTTDPSDLSSGNRSEDFYPEKKESDYIFPLKSPKMKVKRFSQELSVAASSLYLWNLMSFRPLNKPKNFQVILFSHSHLADQSSYFLESFVEIYQYKFKLGNVERISGSESNQLIEDGLLIINESDSIENTVISAANGLKADLETSEQTDEILVIYPDDNQSFVSTLSEVQIYDKFKDIVQQGTNTKITLKIIPSSFISDNGVFSTVSINKLGRLALNIYNSLGDTNLTFTEMTTSLPEKIDFKLTKQPISGELLSQESFIHLSYDRSFDKEWLVAAWTDEHCKFRKTKSWYCANGKTNIPKIRTIEQVMNEIWEVTLKLSENLKGKKHLILTRLNGMIPDDELLHLKRLSSKTRELTLIVVSASDNSKLLLETDDVNFPISKVFNQQSENEKLINGIISRDSAPTVGSSSGLTPSTIFTPQPVISPDLFTMTRTSGFSYESPGAALDGKALHDDQSIITDICDTVYGVMIDSPETLINAPSRFSVKTGYLIKPIKNSHNLVRTFEINLLSCPSNLQNNTLMKTLLTQFRNLSTISELFGVVDPKDSLLPWHVEAVRKAIRCLVHIRVDYESEPVNTTK